MHEDGIAGLDLVGAVQKIVRRHALHEQCGDLAFVESVGQVKELVRRVVSHLGVAAERRNTIGDAVAGLKRGNTGTPTPSTTPTPSKPITTGQGGTGHGM